jgi:hypothetical protein
VNGSTLARQAERIIGVIKSRRRSRQPLDRPPADGELRRIAIVALVVIVATIGLLCILAVTGIIDIPRSEQ